MTSLAIPLGRWADAELARLAAETGSARIAGLSGATLLGERAVLNGFRIPGTTSAGGGCRLLRTTDGWIALNLARADDRALLPALFEDGSIDTHDDHVIAEYVSLAREEAIVARGREMGMAIAGFGELTRGAGYSAIVTGPSRPAPAARKPLVIDLSALWAGPLAGHLLWLAGAEVIKVESRNRPDAMREGDPPMFARLNQGKANLLVDLRVAEDRAALLELICRADIVIEAARPRALLQLGIDVDHLVREIPGLSWITITGHGVSEAAANWVGFGDDCGVAGGLGAAMMAAGGTPGFVGDAIADPATGIVAARLAWANWREGVARRWVLSMRDIAGEALQDERRQDPAALDERLRLWSRSVGEPFPPVADRGAGPVRPIGADNTVWLGRTGPC